MLLAILVHLTSAIGQCDGPECQAALAGALWGDLYLSDLTLGRSLLLHVLWALSQLPRPWLYETRYAATLTDVTRWRMHNGCCRAHSNNNKTTPATTARGKQRLIPVSHFDWIYGIYGIWFDVYGVRGNTHAYPSSHNMVCVYDAVMRCVDNAGTSPAGFVGPPVLRAYPTPSFHPWHRTRTARCPSCSIHNSSGRKKD